MGFLGFGKGQPHRNFDLAWAEGNRTFSPELIQWYYDHEISPLTPMQYYMAGTYIFLLSFFAIGGNFMILVMFCRNSDARKKPMNILILNTAISDFGVGILGYPFEAWSFAVFYFNWGDDMCIFQGWSHFFLALVDMTSLVAFSIYRYLIVCQDCGETLTVGFTVKICVLIWIYAFFVTAMPLCGINSYKVEVFGTVCTIDWEPHNTSGIFFIYYLLMFGFCIPVLTMIFCYCQVIWKTNELSDKTGQVQDGTVDLGSASQANDIIAEAKVTRISVIMVVSYLACWSPFAIISFMCMQMGGDVPVIVKALPHLGAKLSCGINPLIFFATNKVFRDHFLATFMKNHHISSSIADNQSFTIDKSKDGVFLGAQSVTFKKAKTSMF